MDILKHFRKKKAKKKTHSSVDEKAKAKPNEENKSKKMAKQEPVFGVDGSSSDNEEDG